ncbi:hypothetical protein CV_0070 [Chromobacterium violaceum ATCC 12472]|uniref:Uncharacterized protein n=1 Tax=Chromobacterium violaceum (strain ATCC 12472 / DSM 30191 / JCM 1249 / CCUG 213 / NBRC 12614 / NCIMB 9131 / NCTC 9757 / MK) TaxID=243365 RepID=Q7P1Z2_CHRVO|nr:hypothetical protein CV_0070 [Chromobacterium violaceum ATCC 12472]
MDGLGGGTSRAITEPGRLDDPLALSASRNTRKSLARRGCRVAEDTDSLEAAVISQF